MILRWSSCITVLSLDAAVIMSLCIVFLSESLPTVLAFEWFTSFVHLQDVLGQICPLSEGLVAAIIVAHKGLLSSMGAHVVKELGRIGYKAVARSIASVHAAKEPEDCSVHLLEELVDLELLAAGGWLVVDGALVEDEVLSVDLAGKLYLL